MAGDKTELGRRSSELFLDISVRFARRFMALHAVRAESSLEEIDDAAMFKLTGLNFKQIVRESEEPKTRSVYLPTSSLQPNRYR